MRPWVYVSSLSLGISARGGIVLLVLAGLGSVHPGLLCQDTGTVLGRVTSAVGAASLSNALISISEGGPEILSGDEGWYFLSEVPVGLHEIEVSLPGFVVARDTILIETGDAVLLDFALQPDPVALDPLVVTAEARLRGLPTTGRVITQDELANRRANTLTQLLQGLVPGLNLTVTSGDVGAAPQVRIRGIRSLEASPPLFFVDGVRIGSAHFRGPTGTESVLTFLDNITPGDIERIVILSAAEATTFFGTDAAGGAILIYTHR